MATSPIDKAAFASFTAVVGNDPEMLSEFIGVFARSAPEQVAAMKTALAAEDFAALRIAAHSCKSNARDLGALSLAGFCATLEHQSRDKALVSPEEQIAVIEAEAFRAVEALNALDLTDV